MVKHLNLHFNDEDFITLEEAKERAKSKSWESFFIFLNSGAKK